MLESFDYARLNPEAKKYLADVRRVNGRGAPGIFQAVSDRRPIWSVLVGVCLLPLFLWAGYSSNKAPWAMAMLQTAGVLLGGWLIWFGVRRWMANTETFAGYFYYFDAEHAFVGEGERLSVAPVPADAEVVPKGPKVVRVATEMDEFRVPVPNRQFGEQVADFYHALAWVRDREDGPFAELEGDEAGAVAKYMAEENEAPPNVTEADLRIDTMTDVVRPQGRAATGLLGLAVWLGIAGGAYALFFATNGRLQDNMAFADAKGNLGKNTQDQVTGAQGLRDYMLNERNTRNRAEAKELLARLYDAPIATVKNNPAADPQLRDGMQAILESLRGPDMPAVSLAVYDTAEPAATNLTKGLRSRFADGIATAVGKDLIVFGEGPADKPALMTVRYTQNMNGSVAWTAELRVKPDDTAVYTASGVTPQHQLGQFQMAPLNMGASPDLPVSETNDKTEAVYHDVMQKMMGQAPPKQTVIVVNSSEDW